MHAYDRYLLVLDEPDGSLGPSAMQLIELGVDVIYAQDTDEAHLLARQEQDRTAAALFHCPADPAAAARTLDRLSRAVGGPADALAPIGPRPPAEVLALLCSRGLEWGLFEPFAERELRFLATAVLRVGNPADMRKGHRFPTALQGVAHMGEHAKEVVVHDLSRGGAFLAAPFPFPVGTGLDLALQLGEHELRAQAVVVNTESSDAPKRPDIPEGMGVQFTEMAEAERDQLRAFLHDCAARFRL